MVSFEELGLNMSIVKAVKEVGMENPFPIQEHCIPLILKGKDVIGQAHTGTGKTAAFTLPMLQKLAGNACVFGQHQVGIAQRFRCPWRQVAEVTYRCRNHIKSGFQRLFHVSQWHSAPRGRKPRRDSVRRSPPLKAELP